MMRTTPMLMVLLVAIALAGPPGIATLVAGQETVDDGDCTFPYSTTDATGTTISLDAEPDRIVTLNPSAAQTTWEIGAREKVVGLTKYASYLEGAGSRTNVSGATSIVVVETVLALSPDLVLAPNATPTATVDQLRGAGLTVYRFPRAKTIDDVSAKTRTIGRLVGECEGAEETVAEMRDRIRTAREAAEGERRPDVLYTFFGYTAGEGTFIHEVIEAAGGNNVAADYGVVGYRQLNPEVVVEADPDWIVRNTNDPALPEGAPFNSTRAVRAGQVVVVPIEHLNQPAPRIVRGITVLAMHFHPEAYTAANATGTAGGTGTFDRTTTRVGTDDRGAPTTTAAGETGSPDPTGTPGQPGFGLSAALAALLVAFLATRDRG